ncbi:LacI family DNA-binding transcriptional regulator [Roseibium sp.]|uniref:LacI family DNA-binding transcriptional regulator n=2 Tax=Roseibium sp. TaxID=1936156 RepID=UPI003C7DB203
MKWFGNLRATIADVAREAGVSAMTVSRALRDPDKVSAKTRVKIQAVVDRLGYVPDPAASALAAGKTNVIGVIVPSVTNNVFSDVMRGVYEVAEGSKWQIQLGNSRYSPLEEENLVRTFLSQKPAGLILSGLDQSDETSKLLMNADCRIVQIMECGPDPFDMMIGFSHVEASAAATRHLLEEGYQRPGYIAARLDPRSQRRLAGFRAEAEKAGVFSDGRIVTTPRPSTVTLGCELVADLLSKAPETDAILCNNDDLALGALFECQRRGLRVPQDFGICGFNDLEMMAAANPSITSVRTYRLDMGREAFEMLTGALGGAEPGQALIDLGYEVVARQSTARHR